MAFYQGSSNIAWYNTEEPIGACIGNDPDVRKWAFMLFFEAILMMWTSDNETTQKGAEENAARTLAPKFRIDVNVHNLLDNISATLLLHPSEWLDSLDNLLKIRTAEAVPEPDRETRRILYAVMSTASANSSRFETWLSSRLLLRFFLQTFAQLHKVFTRAQQLCFTRDASAQVQTFYKIQQHI